MQLPLAIKTNLKSNKNSDDLSTISPLNIGESVTATAAAVAAATAVPSQAFFKTLIKSVTAAINKYFHLKNTIIIAVAIL